MSTLSDRIPDPKSDIDKFFSDRLRKAALYVVGKIRENISRSQPVRGAGLRKRGLDPSRPGEMPKRVSGRLMRSITWNFEDMLVALVGTTLKYGAILEKSLYLDREYILRTIREEAKTIQKILQTGHT